MTYCSIRVELLIQVGPYMLDIGLVVINILPSQLADISFVS